MPKELTEIVDLDKVEKLFLALALILPILGLAIGRVWGTKQGEPTLGTKRGLLIGLIGVANWLLWRVFNAITERNGLDTVRNLGINFVVFVLAGIGLAVALPRLWGTMPTQQKEVDS